MDPTLSLSGLPPVVLSTREFDQNLPAVQSTATLVVVAEGIPPVSCKLVDKIKKWEYIDLATLLDDHSTSDQVALLNGQLTVVSSNSQRRRQANAISDVLTWLQAFTAILVSSDSTTKEEAAGLAAHSYLIIQLSKDLSGLQWLKYDQSYREWAAAKGIRKWGEMNFSIYGRCLASQQFHPSSFYNPANSSGSARKRKTNANVCFRWNKGGPCSGSTCRFSHQCGSCGGNHREVNCPRRPKRP